MSAALDDMSVVQYKDLIGVADGFQTVGNHDDGLVMGQCSIARCNSSSFSGSTLLVASSKMMIGASFSMARAMEIRCFSPPDKLPPPSPITVS